ncbi:MAG: hypothetical protein FWC89_10165 [Defluviitaleaceae bacterium]|nr:hypothetical protein [Defluviitaleaceae bacterium]
MKTGTDKLTAEIEKQKKTMTAHLKNYKANQRHFFQWDKIQQGVFWFNTIVNIGIGGYVIFLIVTFFISR